jgi:ferredoxin-thioredoxin reductase catalytic subunit
MEDVLSFNNFRNREHLAEFIEGHGSKCVVSNSTKRLCVDRTTDDKDHSDKENHCHIVTQEINRMKSCYSIFFNQKSLDKFRELNKIDPNMDNSEVVGMIPRPMLLSFVNHRKKMVKYTEDDWFRVGNRVE